MAAEQAEGMFVGYGKSLPAGRSGNAEDLGHASWQSVCLIAAEVAACDHAELRQYHTSMFLSCTGSRTEVTELELVLGNLYCAAGQGYSAISKGRFVDKTITITISRNGLHLNQKHIIPCYYYQQVRVV